MIAESDAEDFLRFFLADHKAVQVCLDLPRSQIELLNRVRFFFLRRLLAGSSSIFAERLRAQAGAEPSGHHLAPELFQGFLELIHDIVWKRPSLEFRSFGNRSESRLP